MYSPVPRSSLRHRLARKSCLRLSAVVAEVPCPFSAPRSAGRRNTVKCSEIPSGDAIMWWFCPIVQAFLMFLSVKEMELRKIRFDETFQPGQIDFTDENLEQGSPLHAAGSAEMLAHSEGELRIQGRYTVEMAAV